MAYIAAGALSFLLLCLADFFSLRGKPLARTFAALSSALLFLVGLGGTALRGGLALSVPLRIVGWAMVLSASGMIAASLLLQVPAHSVYLAPPKDRALVTSGMYACARHPGVLSLLLFLAGLTLATGSTLLLLATPVWLAADAAHVIWQERYYLIPKYGGEYRRYQESVPMLVPTARSLRRGVRDILRMRGEG